MRRVPIDSIRWGDSIRRTVTAGTPLTTPDFFRVYAPFPTVWRVLADSEVGLAANFAVNLVLVMTIGVGSFTKQQTFFIPANQTITFEIPGQNMSGRVMTGAPAANDTWAFSGMIAPLIPWEGLNVHAS